MFVVSLITNSSYDSSYPPPLTLCARVTGQRPDTWEGVALVMGNSVAQWKASYNPSRKRRLAQAAVRAHTQARGQVGQQQLGYHCEQQHEHYQHGQQHGDYQNGQLHGQYQHGPKEYQHEQQQHDGYY